MHIAVINLTAGGLSGGYQKYLQSLTPRLAAHSSVKRLTVFSPSLARDTVSLPGIDHSFWPTLSPWAIREWIKSRLAETSPDVVFIPTARWLDCGPVPVTVMVRNMEPLVMPTAGESPVERLRNLARREAARRSCKRARRVIAVSDFVRDFLRSKWRIPESKIGVVYHGVSADSDVVASRPPSLTLEEDKSPFLFTAGSIRPARGLEDAIAGLAILKKKGSHLRLVIAGAPTGHGTYQRDMQRLASRLGVDGEIIWTGTLTPQAMTWCFERCAAYLMTSRVEACPNTALEALAAGALTVSVGNRPMPEFFESSARYYDAGAAEQLVGALERTLALGRADQERQRSKARQRAACFTWEKTTDRTVSELVRCRNSIVSEAASTLGEMSQARDRSNLSNRG
jgi:glycosyltransferase involved in cell wall biosynthesis